MTLVPSKIVAATLLSLAASASFAGAATAESDRFAFKFVFDRSELTTQDGAAKVIERLHKQTLAHCVGDRPTSNLERRLAQSCITTTMENAIGKLKSETAAQAYAARNG